MQKIIFITGLFLSQAFFANAQYEKLDSLTGHTVNIYYSKGSEQRAGSIALLVDSAMKYYNNLLKFTPKVDLLILSVNDWKRYTNMPVVGMPHYDNANNRKLVVAAENNDLWRSFTPPLDKIDAPLAQAIRSAYTMEDGSISMERFFDMLALHELAHAFHMQADIKMQRQWMAELFVNMMLHNFVAEKMPALLPALTVFPKMVVAGGSAQYKYKRLQDIEERYNEIGGQYPKNYGWFQCRWHMAAGDIYDVAGSKAAVKLWKALGAQSKKLDDESFATLLKKKVHSSVAGVMTEWDKKTK
jgi:hypothetical protein